MCQQFSRLARLLVCDYPRGRYNSFMMCHICGSDFALFCEQLSIFLFRVQHTCEVFPIQDLHSLLVFRTSGSGFLLVLRVWFYIPYLC